MNYQLKLEEILKENQDKKPGLQYQFLEYSGLSPSFGKDKDIRVVSEHWQHYQRSEGCNSAPLPPILSLSYVYYVHIPIWQFSQFPHIWLFDI